MGNNDENGVSRAVLRAWEQECLKEGLDGSNHQGCHLDFFFHSLPLLRIFLFSDENGEHVESPKLILLNPTGLLFCF